MRTLGNILWHFPFFGFLFALAYFIWGLICCITIIFIPVGKGFMQFSGFLLSPFKNEMVSESDLVYLGRKEKSNLSKGYNLLLKILYFPFGLFNAFSVIFLIAGEFISIIGIPSAIVWAKSLGTIFCPIGKVRVSKEEAKLIRKRKAEVENPYVIPTSTDESINTVATTQTENNSEITSNLSEINNINGDNPTKRIKIVAAIIVGLSLLSTSLYIFIFSGNATKITLSELSATNYPKDHTTWIITDTEGTTDDFQGLREALTDAIKNNCEIYLKFPSLERFPKCALFTDWSEALSHEEWNNPITSVVSIIAPAATEIGDYAFFNCYGIKSISFSAAKTIGTASFFRCFSLKEVSLQSVTTVGKDAFFNCPDLKSISLPIATTIGEMAFNFCRNLKSISLPAATIIGNGAFYNCKALESIPLPAATIIEDNAFSGCTNLKSISLPAATKIGSSAFSNCIEIESISLPVATKVGENAFWNCKVLNSLEIASSEGVVIERFHGGKTMFLSVPLSNVTLTLGRANAMMIDNNYFNAPNGSGGTYKYGRFAEIVLQ